MNFTQIAKHVSIVGLALATALITSSASAAQRFTRLDGNATKVYTYTAAPGERFRVEISGDGDTDIDLFVRSPNGTMVCRGVSASDDEACSVYSPYGGTYRIELKNLGYIYNEVRLWLD